jgi:hypothetical protein
LNEFEVYKTTLNMRIDETNMFISSVLLILFFVYIKTRLIISVIFCGSDRNIRPEVTRPLAVTRLAVTRLANNKLYKPTHLKFLSFSNMRWNIALNGCPWWSDNTNKQSCVFIHLCCFLASQEKIEHYEHDVKSWRHLSRKNVLLTFIYINIVRLFWNVPH